MRHVLMRAVLLALVAATFHLMAAERLFDFSADELDQPPKGWRPLLAGNGKAGDWRVILADGPADFATLTPGATNSNRRRVIAQLSQDPTDERFPLLVYTNEVFADFTLELRFKTVSGALEQMAGVAFRLQDEKNYYVVRASCLGNTFRFYRVYGGARDNPVGPEIRIPAGAWHQLTIKAKGNRFRFLLDGAEAMPEVTDNTFSEGKLALWTKSDSVSYFTDLRIDYTSREPLAKVLVREAMQHYPRVLNLRLYAPTLQKSELSVVAASNTKDLGLPGGKNEKRCLQEDTQLAGREGKTFIVVLPLRDRNGDPVAAVRVVLERFSGQTVDNAVARCLPIVRLMEGRFRNVQELTE